MIQEKVNRILSFLFTGLASVFYRASLEGIDQWVTLILHVLSGISIFMLIVINWSAFVEKIRKWTNKDKIQKK